VTWETFSSISGAISTRVGGGKRQLQDESYSRKHPRANIQVTGTRACRRVSEKKKLESWGPSVKAHRGLFVAQKAGEKRARRCWT
jgi:hypothetical protein